jgi:hypothetical protein
VRALWDDPRDPEAAKSPTSPDTIWDRCITVYYGSKGGAEIGRVSKAIVEIIGRIGVIKDDSRGIDLWSCNKVYIHVSAVVRKKVIAPAL